MQRLEEEQIVTFLAQVGAGTGGGICEVGGWSEGYGTKITYATQSNAFLPPDPPNFVLVADFKISAQIPPLCSEGVSLDHPDQKESSVMHGAECHEMKTLP
eukprot:1157205-Pelagomonas_calceolata.AAC.7